MAKDVNDNQANDVDLSKVPVLPRKKGAPEFGTNERGKVMVTPEEETDTGLEQENEVGEKMYPLDYDPLLDEEDEEMQMFEMHQMIMYMLENYDEIQKNKEEAYLRNTSGDYAVDETDYFAPTPAKTAPKPKLPKPPKNSTRTPSVPPPPVSNAPSIVADKPVEAEVRRPPIPPRKPPIPPKPR